MMKNLASFILLAGGLWSGAAFAQSQNQIANEISTLLAPNTRGAITAGNLQQVLSDLNNGKLPLAGGTLTGGIGCSAGSTCDVSSMSVTPNTSAATTTLANLMANRLLTNGNDLTANPDNGISTLIPFGNTGAKHYQYSRRSAAQASLLGTTSIIRNTPGSGTFGPGSADYGTLISTTKDNWSTATGSAATEGELDSIYVVARQGKKGDVAGLLMDVAKRRDSLNSTAADETGGLLGFEIGAALTNASGSVYQEVHSYAPFLEAANGLSKGAGYGYLTTGFHGTMYSAYGASVIAGSGSAFSNLIFLDTTGATDGSGIKYRVDGLGRAWFGQTGAQVNEGYTAGTDTYDLRDENSNVVASFGRTSHVATAGGYQIQSGSIETYLKAASGSINIPSLTAFQAASTGTITVAGAQVGDLVTAAITSTDPGFNAFRLFGVVTAANTVDLRVQNVSNATAGGFAGNYNLKVERFTP